MVALSTVASVAAVGITSIVVMVADMIVFCLHGVDVILLLFLLIMVVVGLSLGMALLVDRGGSGSLALVILVMYP